MYVSKKSDKYKADTEAIRAAFLKQPSADFSTLIQSVFRYISRKDGQPIDWKEMAQELRDTHSGPAYDAKKMQEFAEGAIAPSEQELGAVIKMFGLGGGLGNQLQSVRDRQEPGRIERALKQQAATIEARMERGRSTRRLVVPLPAEIPESVALPRLCHAIRCATPYSHDGRQINLQQLAEKIRRDTGMEIAWAKLQGFEDQKIGAEKLFPAKTIAYARAVDLKKHNQEWLKLKRETPPEKSLRQLFFEKAIVYHGLVEETLRDAYLQQAVDAQVLTNTEAKNIKGQSPQFSPAARMRAELSARATNNDPRSAGGSGCNL